MASLAAAPPVVDHARCPHGRRAARDRVVVAGAAGVDGVGAAAGATERPGRTAVMAGRPGAGRCLAAARLARGRRRLRCPVGVLELLGDHALDVHRSLSRPPEGVRDAGARLPRLPAFRPRMLRDVPLAPRAAGAAAGGAGDIIRAPTVTTALFAPRGVGGPSADR